MSGPYVPSQGSGSVRDNNQRSFVPDENGDAARNIVAFKDALGDPRFPLIDEQNRLVVNTELDDVVSIRAAGDNPGAAAFVTLFDIVLQNSFNYQDLEWVCSCFRDATFEILHIDDLGGGGETENMLATVKVGTAQYTDASGQKSRFTTGAVGVQVLRVRAENLTVTSQLEASISINEVQ